MFSIPRLGFSAKPTLTLPPDAPSRKSTDTYELKPAAGNRGLAGADQPVGGVDPMSTCKFEPSRPRPEALALGAAAQATWHEAPLEASHVAPLETSQDGTALAAWHAARLGASRQELVGKVLALVQKELR